MRRLSPFVAALALLFPSSLPPGEAFPKVLEPGPEHRRLTCFAGTWSFRLEMLGYVWLTPVES